MRSKPQIKALDLPASTAGDFSSTAAGMDSTNIKGMHSPKAHDYAFTPSQQIAAAASRNDSQGQTMIRDGSTSSIPDYFTSSSGSADSPASLSRSSSSTSEHPWANLFPEGAAGAATNMPRKEQIMNKALASNLSMSTTSSQSSSAAGPSFKMLPAVGRMHSGNSFASTSTNGSTLNATDMARFLPLEPQELADMLAGSDGSDPTDSSVLIIDIRPSTSFSVARIRGSINLCAPSTLLKRSGVTVQRIEEEMLANEQDQIRFSGWKSGPQKDGIEPAQVENGAFPIERIVVLDTDTMSAVEAGKPSAGGGGACLIGLLRKFDLAGFAGQLHWLVGGFNSFSNKINSITSPDLSTLIDYSSPKHDKEQLAPSDKGPMPMLKRMDSQRRSSMPSTRTNPVAPLSNLDSDNACRQSLVQPRGLPMEAFSLNSTTRRSSSGSDSRGMQLSASQPIMDVDGQMAPGDAGGAACANPFFDNIRQNRELQHGITERIPLELPTLSHIDIDLLPPFLRNLVEMKAEDRTETLAKKFFDVEKAEQRRLIATMQQHASESNLSGSTAKPSLVRRTSISKDLLQLSSSYSSVRVGQNCDSSSKETFPFSIAAALERGSENRYNNIWTYEHSRIRCAGPCDYLNGSYLEPARAFGCKRRYIATQAPLPSTFNTFWQVIWQQNVRTICMVTREFESGRVQSHNYWKEAEYGGLHLKVVEEVTMDAKGKEVDNTSSIDQVGGGNFFPNTQNVEGGSPVASTIRRKLALSQNGETRYIVQLQFVAWPDFSIPDDAEGILDYIRMANKEQHNAEIELKKAESSSEVGPLLVHCSAGVGRTGTYVVIDSVMDVLRRGRRGSLQADVWDDSIATGVRKNSSTFSELAKMTPLSLPLSQPRKSLKRELSPSAMDIDSADYGQISSSPTPFNANGVARHGSSPPPLRRGRSDEVDEASMLSLSSNTTTFSPTTAVHRSSSGSETPSGAMDNMRIAWDSSSPHTPIKSKQIKSAHTPGNDPPISSTNLRSTFAAMPINKGSLDESVDLIQQVVETIREQRMSTVQTGRQFVFAYRAIIEGVIRECKMEQ
jgi:protein tyrosine phosphatase